ncbi:RNA polymerase II transcription factor B subunit 5 [Histoplasma capsulatum H143]|uniref:General transcription and DNA repair factor IIH subunit TFB5 n=1 Tax=Ajellomyces capsulatus (strain H143) TaxID=544712 RepID=C6HPK7_AJECH|nr:RNA polymerase II transcription factor B subunit 5 [Histoplasma capsulatum H143]
MTPTPTQLSSSRFCDFEIFQDCFFTYHEGSSTPSYSLPHQAPAMPRAVKAIILKYDQERHDYIVEDLDDERHLVIKESQLPHLKARLSNELDEKIMQPEESESE